MRGWLYNSLKGLETGDECSLNLCRNDNIIGPTKYIPLKTIRHRDRLYMRYLSKFLTFTAVDQCVCKTKSCRFDNMEWYNFLKGMKRWLYNLLILRLKKDNSKLSRERLITEWGCIRYNSLKGLATTMRAVYLLVDLIAS